MTNNNRKNLGVVAEGKLLPSFKELFQIFSTFILTVFAWIFFRAESLSHAIGYIGGVFSKSLFNFPKYHGLWDSLTIIFLIIIFLIIEWIGRNNLFALEGLKHKFNPIIRWMFYIFLILLIFTVKGENSEFIYFQF